MITRVVGELSRLESDAIREHRRNVAAQSEEELQAQTDEEYLASLLNDQLTVIVRTYREAQLPNLVALGERFLNADDETRRQIENLLPTQPE